MKGLTNEGRPICCYCIRKCMTKEALHDHCMHTYKQHITKCEVGVFLREIPQLSKKPTSSLSSHLSCFFFVFFTRVLFMGVFSRDCGTGILIQVVTQGGRDTSTTSLSMLIDSCLVGNFQHLSCTDIDCVENHALCSHSKASVSRRPYLFIMLMLTSQLYNERQSQYHSS